jgi:hypothetical protein
MLAKLLLSQILHNDALTRGLGDEEARVLVEWLVEQAEQVGDTAPSAQAAVAEVQRLCRRARAIVRFVVLWCHTERGRGAAVQLAATERFGWPLPTTTVEPCELMFDILCWEEEHASQRPPLAA